MKIKYYNPIFALDEPLQFSVYEALHEYPHIHEACIELIFCLKGQVTLTFAHLQREILEGELILVNANRAHTIKSDTANLCVSLYLNLDDPVFGIPDIKYLSFVCHDKRVNKRNAKYIDYLKLLLLSALFFNIYPNASRLPKIFSNIASEIFSVLHEYFLLFEFACEDFNYHRESKKRFERIQVYLFKNMDKKISAADICNLENISPNYLSQFMKKGNPHVFSQRLGFVRAVSTENLLLSTDMSNEEILYKCGFVNAKSFYRNFKLWYGRTPGQHRIWYDEYALGSIENNSYDFMSVKQELDFYISYYHSNALLKYNGVVTE